ncbi:MAG: F0F1 ATP synthase subunit delta [Lachnospiraceae bacterium]|nr:F0F1 ATP synthase subunit delta [Lachnospiraceae bacterium]
MAKQVAKTYGDALFELALEENKLDSIADNVAALTEAFQSNQELTKLMSHPKISREEKLKVMASILEGRVEEEIAGFIHIVIDKGRYLELDHIFQYFTSRVKEYKNIGTAYVTTAVELRQEQKEQIVKRLLETTKYKTIEVQYTLDQSLIGGMIIRIGDRVVDSSIRTKLQELTRDLTKIQLAV